MTPLHFFIVGAQKSGTTSLFAHLDRHPDVAMTRSKECLYFARDDLHGRGEGYLDSFFLGQGGGLRGAAYANQLCFIDGANRLLAHNPDIKLVAVLRDPVDRAWSAFWHARKMGWEPCEDFGEALDRDAERRRGTFLEKADLTHLAHGEYADQLEAWWSVTPRTQWRVLLTGDLRDPERLADLLTWLDIDPERLPSDEAPRTNTAALPRFARLQRFLMTDSRWRSTLSRALPGRVRNALREGLVDRVTRWNLRPAEYPELPEALRQRLVEHYRPFDDRLEALLDRELTGWTTREG